MEREFSSGSEVRLEISFCPSEATGEDFFFFFNLFLFYLFSAALGLCCCAGATLRCGARTSHCGGFPLLWSMGF